MDGLVKWYSFERGFGFITPLIGKPKKTPDIYYHISAVRDGLALPAGARVSFIIVGTGEGRVQAANVVVKQERLRRTDEQTDPEEQPALARRASEGRT